MEWHDQVRLPLDEAARRRGASRRPRAARRQDCRQPARRAAGAVAHLCAARAQPGADRQGGLDGLPRGGGHGVQGRARRGDGQAARAGPHARQPLLRRQPRPPRQLRAGLEPLLRAGARRASRWAPSCCCTASPIRPTACAMSRGGIATTASSRWRPGCPAHGTVPAALTDVEWEDWLAATKLALREARRRIGPDAPLHVVGFSNGGALAMKAALDALEDPAIPRADRLVLISPMIGVTSFARFAGLAGAAGLFPGLRQGGVAQRRAGVQPVQVQLLPGERRAAVLPADPGAAAAGAGAFAQRRAGRPAADADLPVRDGLHGQHLGRDLGALCASPGQRQRARAVRHQPRRQVRPAAAADVGDHAGRRLLPAGARTYPHHHHHQCLGEHAERSSRRSSRPARRERRTRPLGLAYPRDIYSLSHVAIPFPPSDGLYGFDPDPSEDFGVRLGATASRGEIGVLIVALDSLLRIASNPFFPYMAERFDQVIAAPKPAVQATPLTLAGFRPPASPCGRSPCAARAAPSARSARRARASPRR